MKEIGSGDAVHRKNDIHGRLLIWRNPISFPAIKLRSMKKIKIVERKDA
jgi:hypothetical protein